MKKFRRFIFPVFAIISGLLIFTNCTMGLGKAVYSCSVCGSLYNTVEEADRCTVTRYCPGASKEEIKTKEETITTQETTITKQTETIETQSTTIKTQSQQIDDLNKLIEEKLAYIKQLDDFIEERKTQLGITEEDLANANSLLEVVKTAIDNLITERSQLQENVRTLREDVVSLNTKIDVLKVEQDRLNNQVTELNTRVTQLNDNITVLTEEKHQLEASVETLNNKVTELNTTVTSLQKNVEELNTTIETKNQEITELNTTIDQKNLLITEKDQIITEKNQLITEKQAVINKQEAKIEEQVQRIEALDKEVATLEKDITQKNQIIEEKQAEIKKQEETIISQQTKISEQKTTIETQKTEIATQKVTIEQQVTKIKEHEATITEQAQDIAIKKEQIEQQQEVIKELSDALGSKLNFTSKGFENNAVEVKPCIWLDKESQSLTYQEYIDSDWCVDSNKTNKNIHYLPRLKGEGFGYRSYNYWTFYYTLKKSDKNLVYRVIYDEKYNDWSSTSSEEVRVTYGNDRVFDIYTSVVCLNAEKKIWVMKLVDLIDLDKSYYTLVKETGENTFMSFGKYEALTDAINADYSCDSQWKLIDYSSFATAEGMDIGADTIESYLNAKESQ